MKIKYLFTIYLLLISIACSKKEIIEIAPQERGEIEVNVLTGTMLTPIIDNNTTRTKVVDENTLDNLRILLFDENDIYLGNYVVSENNLVGLPFSQLKRTVYVVANAANQIDNNTWIVETTTLDQILESLVQDLAEPTGNVDVILNAKLMPATPFSMYATLVFPNGIAENSAINSTGLQSGGPLLLKRNVAKIVVSVNSGLSRSFKIKRIMLCYAPSKGYLLQDKLIFDNPCNYTLYDYIGVTPPSIYSYSAGKTTTVIIEAQRANQQNSSYYKIAIKTSQSEGAIGLKHNMYYHIQITSVSGNGFNTLNDAIVGSILGDIETTLEIRDITMHDYLFSEDRYIGFSNSIYVQYGSDKGLSAHYDVSQIRFGNASTGLDFPVETVTSVSVKGLDGNDVSSYVELDPKTITDITNAQNHVTYSVKIKLLKSITSKLSVIISVSFDDFTKDILVDLHPELTVTENQFILIDNIVTIYVENSDYNWVGVNDINIFTTNKYVNFNTNKGWPVYITVRKDAGLTQPREVDIYATKGEDGYNRAELYDHGRLRIHIIQN